MTAEKVTDSPSRPALAPAPATAARELGGPSSVLLEIRVKQDSLFPAERRIAEFVSSEPSRVIHMPIAELAQVAAVSEGRAARVVA